MKHLFSSAVVILFGVLSQGCIEEVAPTPVAEKNNLIVLGEIHYPKDYATVVLKEISSDQVYTEKVVSNASIALHRKSSDGTAEELPVVFEYDPLYKRYRTKERVPTQVGETYWITLEVPGRTGVYQSKEETLLPQVYIKGFERVNYNYRVIFSDPKGTPNQYLVQSENDYLGLETGIDTLFDGNNFAFIEFYFFPGENGVRLSNISPSTYAFYKGLLEQSDQNESYSQDNEDDEEGDPSMLFRTQPAQLSSNLFNTQNTNEIVLGHFGAFSNSFFFPEYN